MTSNPRSVKISDSERSGWSSERPLKPGESPRPPRPVNVSVRGRVLTPADHMRYAPGSLLLVACVDHSMRDIFCDRVLADPASLYSMGKVRSLLEGRVSPEVVDEKAQSLMDAAVSKRLTSAQTVVIALESLEAAEREHYVRMAQPHRRPRHLILLEAGKDKVAEEDRAALGDLRTALDAGELGQEGFVTSLRLGGHNVTELKRIVFAPPPRDD